MTGQEPHIRIVAARWVLPVSSPPIRNGAVVVIDGRIHDIGPAGQMKERYQESPEDYGEAVLAPAWINAHCHLELSGLALEPGHTDSFVEWVRNLVSRRNRYPEVDANVPEIIRAAGSIADSGTALIGDVTNGGLIDDPQFPMDFERVVFCELIGFRASDAGKLLAGAIDARNQAGRPVWLTPHAVYSVSARLMSSIGRLNERLSVHVAESAEESRFTETGGGSIRTFLEERGVWDPEWEVPGCSPVMYLERLGLLRENSLLVHGVQLDEKDMDLIVERKAAVCLCPRSNARLGVGKAPVRQMLDRGIPLCAGTDSLASNTDLDLSNELLFLAEEHGIRDWKQLLAMGTLNGARALGREFDYGSLEAGKKARMNVFMGKTENPEKYVAAKLWKEMIRL